MAAINNFVVVVADARYIWEMKGVDDAFWQLIWQSTIGGAKYFDDFIVKNIGGNDQRLAGENGLSLISPENSLS